MKKLHILIPSLVATASMPLVSLVGCGNPDTPTPPEPEPEPVIDYTVTQEEMESAIGMDDIVFLQFHSEINMMLQSQLWQTISDVDYSPDAMYESLEEQGGELSLNQKKYIVHDNERFIQYSIGGMFDDWTQEIVDEDKFETPEIFGQELTQMFYSKCDYSKLTFDADKKCYVGEVGSNSSTISYYFENKKLVKLFVDFSADEGYGQQEFTFTYENNPPEPPIPSNIVLNVEDANALRTKFWYYDLEAKKYNFKIDMHSWSSFKPDEPDSYIFLIEDTLHTDSAKLDEQFTFTATKGTTVTKLEGELDDYDQTSIKFNKEADVSAITEADEITCEITITEIKDKDYYFTFFWSP